MNKNLCTNGLLLIFKIYFHNIRVTPSPPLAAHRLRITALYCDANLCYVSGRCTGKEMLDDEN
jgi:hypothetical protein